MEDLFVGPPGVLPAGVSLGQARYGPLTDGQSGQVRHVGGYAVFARYCEAAGAVPAELAADPAALAGFLQAHGPTIRANSDRLAAAAVFTGNTIAGLRPDASWTVGPGGAEVGNHEARFVVRAVVEGLCGAGDEMVQAFAAKLRGWAQEDLGGPAGPLPVPASGHPVYIRPSLPDVRYFSGADARRYGGRWDGGGPPQEAYEVVSNPGRFAGLHAIADALISHLEGTYAIDVREDPALAGDLLLSHPDVRRAVRLTPHHAGAAPLTFVFTGFPGVIVHAGVLHDFPFPACGCDETSESTADRLEMLVLGVAAGGYAERYPVGRRHQLEYVLAAADGSGSESGCGEPGPIDGGRLGEAAARLRDVAVGWGAWPLRKAGRMVT